MRLKRILRFVLIPILVLLIAVLVLIVAGVAPINRSPDRTSLYSAMQARIDTIHQPGIAQHGFRIGFAKQNLTPSYPTATAGYGKRMGKLFSAVHDSIFVRTIVIDNGSQRVAIVSADLLIIPPTVTAVLEKELPEIGFTLDNTYLSAIHSHNSIGNWGQGVMTFLYGSYDDSVVHFIADQIKRSIQQANLNKLPSHLKTANISLPSAVHNRLISDGPVDSLLRVVEIRRSDSTRLLMMSFTAHATCLFSRDYELSRDYPGKLVDTIEAAGYAFAMFMAGPVGSHTGSAPEQGEPCVDWMADAVSNGFLSHTQMLRSMTDSTLMMRRVPLLLGDPQAKVLKNWRIRPWLFNLAFGDYPEYLTVLRLGNIIMLGTPCDFSGEFSRSFDRLAEPLGMNVMITSFNGGYIGYVTPDKYYDRDHYETQLMNWYGPGNGDYVQQCMKDLLFAVAGNESGEVHVNQ